MKHLTQAQQTIYTDFGCNEWNQFPNSWLLAVIKIFQIESSWGNFPLVVYVL